MTKVTRFVAVLSLLGISGICHSETLTRTFASDACINMGEDPNCWLSPCDNIWRYVIEGVTVLEAPCPPGYTGWGYLSISLSGSSFKIHCCPEGTQGFHTYHFATDKITILFTTVDCKEVG